jgi:hypothetical protein
VRCKCRGCGQHCTGWPAGRGRWLLMCNRRNCVLPVSHGGRMPHQHPDLMFRGISTWLAWSSLQGHVQGSIEFTTEVVPERYFVRSVLSRRAWGLLTAIVCPDCCNATQ